VRAWAWLLRGYRDDLEGNRAAAEEQYKLVLKEPYGDARLAREAQLRLRHPFRSDAGAKNVPDAP
jgi:hypothetical protein